MDTSGTVKEDEVADALKNVHLDQDRRGEASPSTERRRRLNTQGGFATSHSSAEGLAQAASEVVQGLRAEEVEDKGS